MADIRPRRSVLYMPGSHARALEKAKSLPADALILDLEDAVAPEAKEEARARVCAAVAEGSYGGREVVIRINGIDTPWGKADLAEAADAMPDAILVPKVSRAEDMRRIARILDDRGTPARVRLWAMMETPLAMLEAGAIAATAAEPGGRLACLVMGTNDLARETRVAFGGERTGLLAWLSTCVAAARAFGLDIVDGVYNDFRDETGFLREAEQGRALGMDGKTLIHPAQIAPCNAVFSPTEQDIAWAEKVIAAFTRPENADKGAISLDGRMVERLHAEMAERTLAIRDAIAARDGDAQ